MLPLREVQLRRPLPGGFPFTLDAVRHLEVLPLPSPVTFFVGENGTGKSTLLEGLAVAAGLPSVGSQPVATDPTLAHARALAGRLRLVWNHGKRQGFFMRAEDFFGYAQAIAREAATLRADIDAVRAANIDPLAASPHARELGALRAAYGDGLDAQSHGESFFKLFQARLRPGGLYLLDEPEAPLSPLRQLAFLALLHHFVRQGAQFVIATHAPMLLAYPDATCYVFAPGAPPQPTPFDALQHVTLMRDFLADPARMLTPLLADDDADDA